MYSCYAMVDTCKRSMKGRTYIRWTRVGQYGYRRFKMLCEVSEPVIMVEAEGLQNAWSNGVCPGMCSVFLGDAFCRSIVDGEGELELLLVVLVFSIFILEGM